MEARRRRGGGEEEARRRQGDEERHLPPLHAACSAVRPSLFDFVGSAPASIRSLAIACEP